MTANRDHLKWEADRMLFSILIHIFIIALPARLTWSKNMAGANTASQVLEYLKQTGRKAGCGYPRDQQYRQTLTGWSVKGPVFGVTFIAFRLIKIFSSFITI